MKHRTLALTALLMAALATSSTFAQTQWKWRDAQGRLQFSDRPPPQGTPDKDILVRPPGAKGQVQIIDLNAPPPAKATAPAAAASSAEDRRKAQEKTREEAEANAKRKEVDEQNARVRADNCRAAQQNLRSLETQGRVARVNEKGEREFMDDTQRQREITKSRDQVSRNCN